jgi:acetylornithine deacetylase/succinyl-diaminopimelate desuccinylase family protein
MEPALTDAVRARIASYEGEIAEFARRLVAIPTENPPGEGYGACVAAISAELQRFGIAHRTVDVPAGVGSGPAQADHPRYCLLGQHGSAGPTLYFHGHYDVVPAQRRDQFEPRFERGRLYGRGSSDMKSGLAAMIYAVRALKELDLRLVGQVGLCIVPDEETGGAGGSSWLARNGLLGRDAVGMLTAEPTSGVIWNANRGAVTLKVTVRGKAAHVGLQHQGINAFEGMLSVARALGELRVEVEQRQTGFPITPDLARRSILMMGGRVEGGTNFNAVPEEVSFTVDRRINPEEDLAVEKARLVGVLERLQAEGVRLDYEVLQEAPSSGTPEDDRLAQTLADVVARVRGTRPAFEMCPGLLEIRFYAQQGVPALAYGPGLFEVSHGPHECVELQAVFESAAVYALTAARFLAR